MLKTDALQNMLGFKKQKENLRTKWGDHSLKETFGCEVLKRRILVSGTPEAGAAVVLLETD